MGGLLRGAILLGAIVAMPCCLQAQEKPSYPPYIANQSEMAEATKACKEEVGELGIGMCAMSAYLREDAKYRLATKEVSQALADDREGREFLARANRMFEQFRIATCSFDSRTHGSMAGSLLYGCLELYTRRRARALKAYAVCGKTGDCEQPNLLYMEENRNEPAKRR